ncbi:MAG: glycoside hydrolase family 127 protein [Odoribacter sp.]|nr:glycoside hydrolase family 127 protein [Odoribacter sp.]
MKNIGVILFCFLFFIQIASSQNEQKINLFPLSAVRLTESPFKQAQETDKQYILNLDADRLVAPYLKAAGLTPKAENYPNWENTGLDGHIGGHYLSALSQMYAATGDKAIYEKLQYFLDELKKCQDAHGNGYVGGVVNGKQIWDEIARGEIRAGNFELNKGWVPLYNMDKTFHGLRDAWLYTGNSDARDMLIKLTDWMMGITQNLSEQQMQDMLRSEHGGLNEVFVDIYEITKDQKYLELAHRFSHQAILQPLLKKEDKLTGLHANTQIPKVIGYKRIADLENNAEWNEAARYFWDNVINNRTVIIGGNSVREHFHPIDDFSSMITEEQGPETCNTYNMLRLSSLLYQTEPSEKYIGFYEQALYNHILSSQHPEKGGFVYFTPMRPRHYRVYSQQHQGFWCCVGTGLENHARYGELIYSHSPDNLYINLYIPSILNWEEKQTTIQIATQFPESEKITILINPNKNKEFTLNLRYPAWVKSQELIASINGKPVKIKANPSSFIALKRKWKKGDQIQITLPRHLSIHHLPDNSDYIAIMDGPFVLAAKTGTEEMKGLYADDSRGGHIASGTKLPLQNMPMLVADSENEILQNVQPVNGKPLTYTLRNNIEPEKYKHLELIPFFTLHDARYIVYFPYTTREGLQTFQNLLQEQEQEKAALQARTIDIVYIGEQQPESDHFFQSENAEAGTSNNRHWRRTKGWFQYELRNPEKESVNLSFTFYGEDETATFILEVNGENIGEHRINRQAGKGFYTINYKLPDSIQQTEKLQIKILAKNKRNTPQFYEVRLIKNE